MKKTINNHSTSDSVRWSSSMRDNIKRKLPILNRDIQFFGGIPIPSWIELSLIDVCNRTCSFCPKSNPLVAPDTFQKMDLILIDKLVADLKNDCVRKPCLFSEFLQYSINFTISSWF